LLSALYSLLFTLCSLETLITLMIRVIGSQAPSSIHPRLPPSYYEDAMLSMSDALKDVPVCFVVFADDVAYARETYAAVWERYI
jgi:hypothetical protein